MALEMQATGPGSYEYCRLCPAKVVTRDRAEVSVGCDTGKLDGKRRKQSSSCKLTISYGGMEASPLTSSPENMLASHLRKLGRG